MTLEQLFNKLIDMGWKPYGKNYKQIYENLGHYYLHPDVSPYSINDLCSIDSGLWQFVCCNDLYFEGGIPSNGLEISGIYIKDPRYWLMLSSIQKDKEKFLLENIKI